MATLEDDPPITERTPPGKPRQVSLVGPHGGRKGAHSRKPTPGRKTTRKPGTLAKTGIPASRAFLAGRVKNPERVIAMELILAEAIYLAVVLYDQKAPSPRVMAALLAVFGILGFVTIFGPKWGRVAYLFGGLIVLATLFNKETAAVTAKVTGTKANKAQHPVAETATTLIQTAVLS